MSEKSYERIKAGWKKRRQNIVEWRDEYGWTFTQIGQRYGISRARAQQLYAYEKKQSD